MSLSKFVIIDKDVGAVFNSYVDGKKFILSPEESIKIQKDLNSDIVMVLDECPKLTNDKNWGSFFTRKKRSDFFIPFWPSASRAKPLG